MSRTILTSKHIEEVLDRELIIGSDKARNGERKRFTFHVWMNEYRVELGGKVIDSGQAQEELLEVYNDL